MAEILMERTKEIIENMNILLVNNNSPLIVDKFHDINQDINTLIENIRNKKFKVAVIATTKAGKSTFLNAIIGDEYLPTSNIAETSNILYIQHTLENASLQRNSEMIYGISSIYDALRERHEKDRKYGLTINDKYLLYVPFEHIKNVKDLNFQFTDTPGPNEKGEITILLQKSVEVALKNADVIVYLLDYTRLNTNDEYMLFNTITKLRNDLLVDIKDRFYFVVNKFDLKNKKSKTYEETINYIKSSSILPENLRKSIPKIHCISAEKALLSRMIINGNLSRIDDLGKSSYGDDWDETLSNEEKRTRFPNERLQNILEKSGILDLENEVLKFIITNRESLFYKSILKKAINLLQESNNRIQAEISLCEKSQVELKRIYKEIKSKTDELNKKLEAIDKILNSFSQKIKILIKDNFEDYENLILKVIKRLLQNRTSNKVMTAIVDIIDPIADAIIENNISNMESNGKKSTKAEKDTSRKILKGLKQSGEISIVTIANILKNLKEGASEENAKGKMKEIDKHLEDMISISLNVLRVEIETTIGEDYRNIYIELQRIINQSNNELFDTINYEFNTKDELHIIPFELPKVDGFSLGNNYDNAILKKRGICNPKFELNFETFESQFSQSLKKMRIESINATNKYIDQYILNEIELTKKEFNKNVRIYTSMIEKKIKNVDSDNIFIDDDYKSSLDELLNKNRNILNKINDINNMELL